MKKIIKYIGILILIFIVVLLNYSVLWALDTFNFLNFDEIIFQLTTPIQGTETTIINSFFDSAFKPAVFTGFLITFLIYLYFDYVNAKRITIKIKLWKKNLKLNFKAKILKRVSILAIIVIIIINVANNLNKVKLFEYIKSITTNSDFIGENYVEPTKVELEFPKKKKNLIYIFAESLESSFFSKELGGLNKENVMEPLLDLTNENIYFSHSDKIGGGYNLPGTTWTSGAMVGQTSGLPLKLSGANVNTRMYKNMVPGSYTIGDVLNKAGYNQTIMFGSQANFGNRGLYFKEHGNYYIYDYEEAKKLNKIPKKYLVWWGFEDSKLFKFAKEEALKLSKEDEPFNLTLLTANTHFQDGYIEDDCNKKIKDQYSNSIYCSAEQIRDFINWVKKQDFYEDTTIVVVGDHVSMQKNYLPDTNRYVYNLFINSSIKTNNNKKRKFSTLDMYPTTLAALGVKIKGDRLALGTNLFSNKKTLIERYGFKYVYNQVSYNSKFYLNKILLNK